MAVSRPRPLSKRKRLLRLAGMTVQVAKSYAGSRIKQAFQSPEQAAQERVAQHQRAGAHIARTLGELKGAVMKVGQMASIAKDLLPPEVSRALKSLQREAPPMPYNVIASQIERELGRPPEFLFRRFERTPFAAASIGQVHRACTDTGLEVVVKVQYPGVDEAVDSDLAHLKMALRASGLVRVPRIALDEVFEEIKARLHEELDYCNEASNVRFFANAYQDNDRVVVPEVVGERSSSRVLTLTFEPGHHLSELDELAFGPEIRDQLGATLFSVVMDQLFRSHTLHADPNPANFAFRPNGVLVLYDFGCVKHLDPEVMETYRDTVRAGLREDYEGVERGLLQLGARNPQKPPLPPQFYRQWREVFFQPFEKDQIYDYGTSDLYREVLSKLPGFLAKHASWFQPASELVFVDRIVVGHYGNLQRLRARINAHRLLLRYL